jgi:hypothetical protein
MADVDLSILEPSDQVYPNLEKERPQKPFSVNLVFFEPSGEAFPELDKESPKGRKTPGLPFSQSGKIEDRSNY